MTNIAILGTGIIARTMAATLRGMQAAGEAVCLYGAASRDEARAAGFARKEGFARSWGSYEAMLADPGVDLVYVATPHSHHAEHIRLCVEAGKAVLCEKAFCANREQAADVLSLAEARGVLVTEAIWTRYMPSRRMLDELVAAGTIGEVRLVCANLGYGTDGIARIREPALAGGALLDLGVYALNFASMALGDGIASLKGTAQLLPTGVDLTDSIVIEYESGAAAQLSATAACRTDRRGIIYGTRGWLAVDNINNPGRIEVWDASDWSGNPAKVIPVPAQITGYEYEVRACLKALDEGLIECPEMPHAETLEIMRQMDALRAQWGVQYPWETEPGNGMR